MGSLIKKNIYGKNYYYYVESKRINGKPTMVNQKYIGSAEKILELSAYSEKSLQSQVLFANKVTFGAVALLYDIGMRLGIPDIINSMIAKRTKDISVGMYLFIAAINRAVVPSSNCELKAWYESTALPYLTGYRSTLFSPQNFWDNTCITADQLTDIEDAMLERTIAELGVDTRNLMYDATNFFTYIDINNPPKLAKRRRGKAKSNGLKTVGLGLLTSPDFSIPLLSEVNPGNRDDTSQFAEMISSLERRFMKATGENADITFAFDRGNDPKRNLDILENGKIKMHCVGELKRSQVPEMFSIPQEQYVPLECPDTADENYKELTVYRQRIHVFDRDLTAVIVYNPRQQCSQKQGIDANIEKTKISLSAIQDSLLRQAKGKIKKGEKPTVESVTSSVEKTLQEREYMEDIFLYEVIKKGGYVYMTYTVSEEKKEALEAEILGKSVLFTDRNDLTNYEIVSDYRSAWHIESTFNQMNNTEFLAVHPIFHWTHDKIRVHLFICMLACLLRAFLRKELEEKKISCTIDQALSSMQQIERVTIFYGNFEKPKKIESFTVGNELAKCIEKEYRLRQKYYN